MVYQKNRLKIVLGIQENQTARNKGAPVESHFAEVGKMVSIGQGNNRPIRDYRLSRYTCYLIAQNGEVRDTLERRGIYLEDMPPEEDTKKIERKARSKWKKLEKEQD